MEMVNQRKNKERKKIEHIANKSKSVELRHSFSKRLLNNPPNQKKGKKRRRAKANRNENKA